MSQKEEFERFERKGEFPYKEPLEPDELHAGEPKEHPNIKKIHVPKGPINEQSLKVFLAELKPIVRGIQLLNQEDQNLIKRYLINMSKMLAISHLPVEIVNLFEKMMMHFGALIKHYTPTNHSETLFALQKLLNQL